jgi:hypothetical protein
LLKRFYSWQFYYCGNGFTAGSIFIAETVLQLAVFLLVKRFLQLVVFLLLKRCHSWQYFLLLKRF